MTDGAGISRAFYREAVAPLLAEHLPSLRHAAGRVGSGSDALGLDDAQSRDHDWGCRLTVLVDDADDAVVPVLRDLLAGRLPGTFRGLPTRFAVTWEEGNILVSTSRGFAVGRLGADPLGPLTDAQWLAITGQSVLEVTAGPVFADTTTEFRLIRDALRWYPPHVERQVLAAAWRELAETLPLAGRTGQLGHEMQSRVLAAELCRGVLRLAFLLRRSWPPYPKWTEALFRRLPGVGELTGPAGRIVCGADWREREAGFAAAADILVGWQRDLGWPAPARATAPFWDRPYLGLREEVTAGLVGGGMQP